MPSNTATKISTIFQDKVITDWFTSLFLQRWSLWSSAVSFGYISFITFRLFVCSTSFYLSLNVILTSHFSNITYFGQQQQQNKTMKYYKILLTHTDTPRNTTREIANLYIEFNCHFLTLQKNPITFEQECTSCSHFHIIWLSEGWYYSWHNGFSLNVNSWGKMQHGMLGQNGTAGQNARGQNGTMPSYPQRCFI